MTKTRTSARRKPAKSRTPTLDIESFRYLAPTELPALLLGIHIPADHFREDSHHAHSYRFAGSRKWERVAHDGGGLSGERSHYWIATRLTILPEFATPLSYFLSEWTGRLTPSLDTLMAYRAGIKRYLAGADCNDSYPLLSSNHFPLDVEGALELVADSLPSVAQLDDLLVFDSGLDRARGSLNRWNAVILAAGAGRE